MYVCMYLCFVSFNTDFVSWNFAFRKFIRFFFFSRARIDANHFCRLSALVSSANCSASSSWRCHRVAWSDKSSTAWSTSSTVTSSHNMVRKHALMPTKGHWDSAALDANHAGHILNPQNLFSSLELLFPESKMLRLGIVCLCVRSFCMRCCDAVWVIQSPALGLQVNRVLWG